MSLKTLEKIIQNGHKLTPMMDQYYSIKKNYPDIFLLYRMGDFYELFFDDAVEASKILNITLTHRGKIGDVKIPMAGIPHHAASTYIDRITSKGLKAAICEQVEDPKKAVGIVKRAVTRIVSPGMPYDLERAANNENKFIACGTYINNSFQLILIDYTTGLFKGHYLKSEEEFLEKLKLYSPHEIITFMGQFDNKYKIKTFLKNSNILKTYLSSEYFNAKFSNIYISKLIPSFEHDKTIKSTPEILSPIGALGFYITSTQSIKNLHHLRPFQLINEQGKMNITLSTLKGLEILPRNNNEYKNSLLGHLDKTITSMGSRFIKNLFISPSSDLQTINERHDLIDKFISNNNILISFRDELKEVRDVERILAKISSGKVTASDTLNLKQTINAWEKIHKELKTLINANLNDIRSQDLKKLLTISKDIENTINDEIGASFDKGNLIRAGFNKKRDRLKRISENTLDELKNLEKRYRIETKINTLKIKFNNVAGYFVEISKSHLDKVPESFKRKQTLTNSERYLTEELIQFEKEVLSAKDKLLKLEKGIFNKLIESIININIDILTMAHNLSFLDTFLSFAWTAYQENFTRPKILPNKKILKVKGGWHPLIKANILDKFIAHDLLLNDNCYFGLITGPNMAGKTTVMREMAIIQFLCQIGSFIPAKHATLSICDYLFSRLGASDNITRGQSTFMVEMTETAEILRHATNKSLIILDEVGRGTSTHDGLAIAWSLTEHLIQKTQALCLFATHYHELIEVIDELKAAKNLTVEIINKDDNIHFLYRLIEQGAEQSFGIYVASLAGLPPSILERSKNLLNKLENKEKKVISKYQSGEQLSFLDDIPEQNTPVYLLDIEKELQSIDIVNMTPLQALGALDNIKKNIPLQ